MKLFSVMAQLGLTGRFTNQTDTQVEHNERMVKYYLM